MTTAACLLIAAGIGGAMLLGSKRPAVTPPVSTDVTTEATTENASTEPLPSDLGIEDLRSMMEQNAKCLDYFLTLDSVSYNSIALSDNTYEVTSGDFASYTELKDFVHSTFCDDFAEELLTEFPRRYVLYLEYDGKFCLQPWTSLDGVSFYEDWSSVEITNPANVDENTVTFDVTVNRIYDDNEKIPTSYTCKAIRESDGWCLEKLYGYEEPQINGLYLEDLRNLMYRNADCLEYFVTAPLSHKGDYLGVGIYEVDSDQVVSYDALKSFVYSTYRDEFANELLTSYPRGDALYFEYDGKFCIQPSNAIDGISLGADWSSFEITNPAAKGEDTIVFDVVLESIYDDDEPIGYTCTAIREDDGWRLEKLYGYEMPAGTTSVPNDSAEEEILHELVEKSMQVHGNYTLKSEALSGTTLH